MPKVFNPYTRKWEWVADDTQQGPSAAPSDSNTTSVIGLLKGNGSNIVSAVAGADYLAPTGSCASMTGLPVAAAASVHSHSYEPASANIQEHISATSTAHGGIAATSTTSTDIKMDGTQSAGSLAAAAKADHVHPTDSTRQPLNFVTRANGTLALSFTTANTVQVTPTATGSFTTTVPAAGTRCNLIILTSGTSTYTMTFGAGFKSVGTLATGATSARRFCIEFVSDGTFLIETGRTAAMA